MDAARRFAGVAFFSAFCLHVRHCSGRFDSRHGIAQTINIFALTILVSDISVAILALIRARLGQWHRYEFAVLIRV